MSTLLRSRLAAGALLFALLGCGGRHWDDDLGPYQVAYSVAALDLDQDGRTDLAFAMATYGGGPPHPGFVSRRYQDPAQPGSYRDPIRQDANRDPIALAAGDLDGDGRPDLVVANTQTVPDPIQENTLSLLLSGPQITLVMPPRTLALGRRDPLDLALADFNGDGKLDIALAARGGKDVLVFLQGAGVASFGAPVAFPLSAEPTSLVAADLNGDGKPDLAVGLASGAVAVLLQDSIGAGPGLFRPPVEYALGGAARQIRVADLDRDGLLDLAAVHGYYDGTLSLLLQDKALAGRFQTARHFTTGDAEPRALAIADLDGDGRPEMVVANYGRAWNSGSLAVFHDGGLPASFELRDLYPGYWGPRSLAIADVNGDGLPDLVIADGEPMARLQEPGHRGYFLPPTWFRY